MIAENVCQARNLFKTEFAPQPTLPAEMQQRIADKLHSEFDYATKHFEETLKKDNPVTQSETADGVINQIIRETQMKKETKEIPSLAKYEQNIGEEGKDANEEQKEAQKGQEGQGQLVLSKKLEMNLAESTRMGTIKATSLRKLIRPKWHRPYKLYRVIVGHHGWVRCLAISPCNNYFASGSADRTVKFWDLASGELKVSLTGHINSLRAL